MLIRRMVEQHGTVEEMATQLRDAYRQRGAAGSIEPVGKEADITHLGPIGRLLVAARAVGAHIGESWALALPSKVPHRLLDAPTQSLRGAHQDGPPNSGTAKGGRDKGGR